MPVNIPKVKENRSFSIVACFTTSSQNNAGIKKDVPKWLLEWVKKHEITTSKQIRKNEVSFRKSRSSDHFSAVPCVINVKNKELGIRLDGKADSNEWKNWFVQIVTALLNLDAGLI